MGESPGHPEIIINKHMKNYMLVKIVTEFIPNVVSNFWVKVDLVQVVSKVILCENQFMRQITFLPD